MNSASRAEEPREFEISRYPKSRLGTIDVGRIGYRKHHVVGLLEVDVTEARSRIRSAIRAGAAVSFTAWVLKTIGITVAELPIVHAINRKRRTQVRFRDVDISIPVEKELDGAKVPLMTVVRSTNSRSIEEIFADLSAAAAVDTKTESGYVLERRKSRDMAALFFNLPQFLRMVVWRWLLSNPFVRKANMGTVIVTNVGSAGRFTGWIVPKSIHNLCFGIGSISCKPWVHRNAVVVREILCLTVLFDHDVIDGAPAARFVGKLVQNLEHAAGLHEYRNR